MYNEIVLDHFANPRNVGRIENYDARGETGNPADGDRIIVYLRIRDNRLVEVRFQTFGCAAAIAASSMLTVLAMGKTLEEARGITNDHVAQALGGLPPQKHDCSNIAADALQNALDEYEARMNSVQDAPAAAPEEVDSDCKENMEKTAQQKASNLSPQQVQRYLRQIIMPEISGIGQEKLLATRVAAIMPTVAWGDMMLAYLAAVGIGQITCVLTDMTRGKEMVQHVMDLNPEMQLNVMLRDDPRVPQERQGAHAVIVLGPAGFIAANKQKNTASETALGTPHLYVRVENWQGTLFDHRHIFHGQEKLWEGSDAPFIQGPSLGETLSAAFGGTLAVIQLVKLRLQIGRQPDQPLVYDLMHMHFGEGDKADPHDDNSREITGSEGSPSIREKDLLQRMAQVKVLLIGSGGLGSPAAFALAKTGLGTLGLVDHDRVDLSNLNRQILHTTQRIGEPKVASGAKTLQTLNPDMQVNTYQERMTADNVDRLLEGYDLLLDGLDNLPSRYVANQAAVSAAKPFVSAGVLTFYGQSTSILPGDGPCYECIFPQSENNGNAPTCEETGVLGAVPGLMGVIQAAEAIKQLAGMKPSLQHKYLMVDVLENEFTAIELPRKVDCSICAKKGQPVGAAVK